MNIDINNYGQCLSKCDYDGNITLGYEFLHAKKVLSDKNFDIFLSDAITHEFLHDFFMREYDLTTSKLFDAIEHLLCNFKIKEFMFKALRKHDNSEYPRSYHSDILKNGINNFYDYYHIDNIKLIQSYILTGGA